MILDNVPAHSIEAEQSLIATLIMDNSHFRFCDFLNPEDFYKGGHQKIYRAMRSMHVMKEPVDLVTLSESMHKDGNLELIGGPAYLVNMVDNSPAFNTESYVKIIKECSLTRQVNMKCLELISSKLTGMELVEKAQTEILSVESSTREDNIKAVKDIVIQHIERLEKANSTKEGMGYKTGFPNIDNALRIKDGKLIIIAGRPKSGKTSLAVTIAKNMDRMGTRIGFLSIEMPESEIMDRWLSMESNIDSSKLGKYKKLSPQEIQSLNDAGAVFYNSNILLDETGSLDISDVERKCRIMKKMGAQVIFIDQLSQIGNRNIKAGEATSLYSENCTRLARLKKELKLPVFLLHQLNRDMKVRQNKEPIVSDLKQSGKIEEDADAVIFIHRPEEYESDQAAKAILHGKAVLILALNRSGPTYRDDRIRFSHETTSFHQESF